MAKTSAQRQAAYRSRRHQGEGLRRLNTWLSMPAYCALQRLAEHEGISQRNLIERLLLNADDEIVERLEPDTPQWEQYFGVTP